MYFVGDVHGDVHIYEAITKSLGHIPSIQLGDMGLGFKGCLTTEKDLHLVDPKLHKFIRGNHDNPETCKKFPHYLGDYGYLEAEGIFYVSGAWSIDRAYRVENVDWWSGEQLSKTDMDKALDLYEKTKPEIVASHEWPFELFGDVIGPVAIPKPNATASLMDEMLRIHQPKSWVFAHHHKSLDVAYKGTRFVCVNTLETFSLTDGAVMSEYQALQLVWGRRGK